MPVNADKKVDDLYKDMRKAHGARKADANGYRSHGFFLREQKIVLDHLVRDKGPILDIACGSGLMLAPLYDAGTEVVGIDFNEDACNDAHANGLNIIRGDAFNLPIADSTIAQAVNCQFLNQQPKEETRRFIEETARVLEPGGRVVILWRHADSFLHKAVHFVFTTLDRITRAQPEFPQYSNPLCEVNRYAREAGLAIEKQGVTLPAFKPEIISAENPLSSVFGASLFTVFRKPHDHENS